jgi:S-adenosylmethionine hydrolase
MKKLITIADWADDSLAHQEFKSSVEGFLKDASGCDLNFICSAPSTIHASFLTSQIIETEEVYGRPLETIVFLNVDPRLQGQGAPFFVIKLKSGIYLAGPNAGYNFSLVKEKIDELFIYQGFDKGSQFRSRDLYARICAHLMDEMEDELELEEVATSVIPNLTGYYIGHIDNFGNIKTTISLSEFKGKYEYGETVRIKINEIEKKACFVNNLFSGVVGELVIYPGSSGHKHNPYLEISIWRHFTEEKPTTGSAEFNSPRPGMEITIVK